jgi:hypothetical protein
LRGKLVFYLILNGQHYAAKPRGRIAAAWRKMDKIRAKVADRHPV